MIAVFNTIFPPHPPGWPSLPEVLLGEISKFLTPEELGRSTSVCKSWGKYIIQNNQIWNWQAKSITQIENARWQLFAKPTIAFGRKEWLQHIGDPGEVPPLLPNIYEILQSPCPFWPGKLVKDTHILILIPRTITKIRDDGPVTVLLTLRTLEDLLKSSTDVSYRYLDDQVLQKHGDTPIEASYWVLMTKDVIPGSRNQLYVHQKSLVENAGYKVPHLLEAAASISLEYIRSKQRLFSDSPWTYTRCPQKIHGRELVVGGFARNGFYIRGTDYDREAHGVAGSRLVSLQEASR